MNDREIINHLLDIKERLAIVETKVDGVLLGSGKLAKRIQDVELDVNKTTSDLKSLRWVSNILLVVIPASIAAIAKILKP